MRQRNLEAELQLATELARTCGDLLRAEFHRAGGPRRTGPSSAPIDEEIEHLIRARIAAQFPGDAIVGEEMSDTGSRTTSRRTWYLDPHDGTRAFLRGERGSAISIGLVVDDEPVLGVVFTPTAPDDDGDLIAWARGTPLTRNGVLVERAPLPSALTSAHIVAMNTDAVTDPARSAAFAAPARFIARASIAYRLALVAVGEADAAVSWSGPTHYDVAAGHALLRAVGGELFDGTGQPFVYGVGGTGNTDMYGAHPTAAQALAVRGRPGSKRSHGDTDGLAERYPHLSGDEAWKCADAAVLARAQGALLGQVVGDALGQLVEFRSRAEITRSHPGGVRDLVDGGTWGTIAGQPTDDSEMALIMARTIVREGRYTAEHARTAYLDWLRSGPFDVGTTTRRGLTGNPDDTSEANGSLMRLSPLAVHLWRQEPEVVAVTVADDARITHPSEACVDAAVVFAVAIGIAVREGPTPRALYKRVATWVRQREDLHEGVRAIFALDDVAPVADFSHRSGWVLLALRNAFHQVLHAETLEEALVSTASSGGDTDTTAAIAGALLGAVHGRDAVPLRWRRQVLSCRPGVAAHARHRRSSPFWPDDLLQLAERLVLLGPPAMFAAQAENVVSLESRRQWNAAAKRVSSDLGKVVDQLREQVADAALSRASATGVLEEWGVPMTADVELTAQIIAASTDRCTAAMGRALLALEEASSLISDEYQ